MKILLKFVIAAVFSITIYAQLQNQTVNQTKETDKKMAETKDCPTNGVVRLRATFDKSGVVTKTEIVFSSGCSYFDQRAMEAAKEIKFEPAKKNGKKITKVKLIDYTFTLTD